MQYTIKNNGDELEKEGWDLFLKNKFPEYETFWQNFIVPLTGRPEHLWFKDDAALKQEFPVDSDIILHERICIAQLHYSVFMFLFDSFKAIKGSEKSFINVKEVFSGLYSATDTSAELIARYERLKNGIIPSVDAFDANSIEDAMNLRIAWQRKNLNSAIVKEVRNYRNILVHGRITFAMATPAAGFISLPRLGKEREFLDWRKGFSMAEAGQLMNDYAYASHLTKQAFDIILDYLKTSWQTFLL